MGAEVKEGSLGTEIPMLGQSECNWDLVDPIDEQDGKIWIRSLQLVLIQEKGMDAELRKNGTSAASQFDAFRANLTGTTTDLNGLGDRAFLNGVGLHLLKGKVYVQLYSANQVAASFGTLEPEEMVKAQEAARAFGEKIVDKI